MVEIRPFPGLRYDPQQVPALAAVLCPPDEVIPPEAEPVYRQRSSYNVIHLEKAKEQPRDTAENNKYTRAAATLHRWLQEGILRAEERPAIYLHRHHFSHQGKRLSRRGLMAAVRLEDWERGAVLPHEGTLASAKDDRLRLLRATQANISPVFALYDDPLQIAPLLREKEGERPTALATESAGESHELWAITEPHLIQGVYQGLKHQPLYIADGHHRYETALNYKRERQTAHPKTTGNEAFNFVLMTLVDTSDPGLVILPAHRMVRDIPKDILDKLREGLESFFEIEAFPLEGTDLEGFGAGKKGKGDPEPVMGLLGLEAGALLMLKGHREPPTSMMPRGSSTAYRRLDVSLLQHLVLENMLGSPREGEELAYTHDAHDALNRVSAGEYQLAFLLNPMAVENIKAVAEAGERLPGKSTYFYPKLPTGLVIHHLESR
jgi:uncharacterized protein (DUF1015 family)